MKKIFASGLIALLLVSITACSKTSETENPTISAAPDSGYVDTFEDLNLGHLFDFEYTLPHADERWIHAWVDVYRDGEKDEEPLAEISYGDSPDEKEEGHLGFGMINPDEEDMATFMYGNSVSIAPSPVDAPFDVTQSSWDYSINEDEDVPLELGEDKLLAAYRGDNDDNVTFGTAADDEDRMIEKHDIVLLLKIKVEESDENTP